MRKVRFAAFLGAFVGLGALGYFGHKGDLPETLQEPYDSLMGRGEKDTAVEKRTPSDEGQGAGKGQVELPDEVTLPVEEFYPVALIQTPENTHLVYFEKGRAKLVSSPGLVTWSAEEGLVRIVVSGQKVPVLGPDGEVFETRRGSVIDRISRFDYATGQQHDLHPARLEGLELGPEDMEMPEIALEYYLSEERRVLGLLGNELVLQHVRTVYMGGAHPMAHAQVERINTQTGRRFPARFTKDLSGPSFEMLRKKDDRPACSSIHRGSVGLRGPLGALIPVAVAVGELEVCGGKMAMHWSGNIPESALSMLPVGVQWKSGKLRVFEVDTRNNVQDVLVLRNLPGLLVLDGEEWLPGFATEGEQNLYWIALQKGLPETLLGSIGPVVGSVPLSREFLGARESLRLAQVFGLSN